MPSVLASFLAQTAVGLTNLQAPLLGHRMVLDKYDYSTPGLYTMMIIISLRVPHLR